MENKLISRSLRLLSQLMELQKENPFKIKSIANAAFVVDKLPFKLKDQPGNEIDTIPGIGKSIASKINELLETGTCEELQRLLSNTPDGVVEMLGLKGLGAKKISVIWHGLGIENIGELYYACNENRLIEAKGFGLKTQEEIGRMIEFRMAADGKMVYAKIMPFANQLFEQLSAWLNKIDHHSLLGLAGEFRRCHEIIEQLDFVIGADNEIEVSDQMPLFEHIPFTAASERTYIGTSEVGIGINITVVPRENFYEQYFIFTGTKTHTDAVLALSGSGPFIDEQAIYSKAGLQFVAPELREGLDEIELARRNAIPALITFKDLKGCLHNHSTWSDGVNSLEEMALYCRDELKLQYLGISDHSKTAFYAKGLSEQRIFGQHAEIDLLNAKMAPFKIFKGIESDILGDGSLDYSDEILNTFDFVVASVHSNLKMQEDKATARLIKAIENPYTTILGHPTGRLLLSRAGYPVDFKRVIDACAANGVVIEINANPLRLDLDWRFHRYALEKGVMLAINPDAHRVEGFHDMQFGILAARKGGLSAEKCLNAMTLSEISEYFLRKQHLRTATSETKL